MLAKRRPPEHAQAEVYGRGIESIYVSIEIENHGCTCSSSFLYHIVGKLLKDVIVAYLVCISEIRFRDVCAKAKMVTLIMVCI